MIKFIVYYFYNFLNRNNLYKKQNRLNYAVYYFNLLMLLNYLTVVFIFRLHNYFYYCILISGVLAIMLLFSQFKLSQESYLLLIKMFIKNNENLLWIYSLLFYLYISITIILFLIVI